MKTGVREEMIKSLPTVMRGFVLVVSGRMSVFPGEYREPKDLMERGRVS